MLRLATATTTQHTVRIGIAVHRSGAVVVLASSSPSFVGVVGVGLIADVERAAAVAVRESCIHAAAALLRTADTTTAIIVTHVAVPTAAFLSHR